MIELKNLTKDEKLEKVSKKCGEIIDTVCDIYVGDRKNIEKLLAASIANGHVLFEDYPGLGKTTLAKIFSISLGLEYSRIQFTPDLLPSDITGNMIWRDKGFFEFKKGPIFSNVVLADEINRAPPKTQSALLESMEEKQVTVEDETHKLDSPFFVIATQNPIEHEGTYPLPEAQMDRFLMKTSIGYPRDKEEEIEIQERRIEWKEDDPSDLVEPVINKEYFQKIQKMVENDIYVDKCILDYIAEIVRRTRKAEAVEVGSRPRGCLALLKLSRAYALIKGRDFVTPDDVKLFVTEAISHRIILGMEYSLEGVKSKDILEHIIREVPVPKEFEPDM
ncbi:MAG: AAA family ATPase [Thermoplasmatota archaeon]